MDAHDACSAVIDHRIIKVAIVLSLAGAAAAAAALLLPRPRDAAGVAAVLKGMDAGWGRRALPTSRQRFGTRASPRRRTSERPTCRTAEGASEYPNEEGRSAASIRSGSRPYISSPCVPPGVVRSAPRGDFLRQQKVASPEGAASASASTSTATKAAAEVELNGEARFRIHCC
jgi:hypothetical protein